MQSVIRRFPNSLYPTGKNPWQDMWCKGGLLKVRKEIQRGAWWGPGGGQKPRDHVCALQVPLKPTITYGKGRTRWFSSNSQWRGGNGWFLSQIMVNLRCHIFSYESWAFPTLACLNFTLWVSLLWDTLKFFSCWWIASTCNFAWKLGIWGKLLLPFSNSSSQPTFINNGSHFLF
jgi:hypothetical protein